MFEFEHSPGADHLQLKSAKATGGVVPFYWNFEACVFYSRHTIITCILAATHFTDPESLKRGETLVMLSGH